MLSELQTEFGGPDFEVVTVATGRNPPPAMKSFFDEIGVAKPDPAVYAHVCAALGLDPSEIVFFDETFTIGKRRMKKFANLVRENME